jgi:hypothetical protein
MRANISTLAMVVAMFLLAACGLPGAPQPPSLNLPRTVNDLAGWRKGNHVYLAWTSPGRTTDGQSVRHRGPTNICRAIAEPRMQQCSQIAQLPAPSAPTPSESAQYTDILAPDLQDRHALEFATYAVEVLNARGQSAGLSNQVQVPLAPTLPPPPGLRAEVTGQGVLLRWSAMPEESQTQTATGPRHVFRIYRQAGNNPQTEIRVGQVQASSAQPSLLDSSFQWGQTYQYVVTVVTMVPSARIAPSAGGQAPGQNGNQSAGENARQGSREGPAGANPAQMVEIEGDDSAPVTVMPKDIFPPAVPTGLEAVFSGPGQQPFIDLIWNPSPEFDLAGYNVYRSSGGQAATRINSSLILTPAFRDSNVQPGTTYQYSITSVDVRGNESARSQAASESVP